MSLRDDTMDGSSLPLESSTPNQSIDSEALAAGFVQELVSDIGNGEFTNDLMEGENQSLGVVSGGRSEGVERQAGVLSPAEAVTSPATVVSEAGSENVNEERGLSADTTTRSMNTLE